MEEAVDIARRYRFFHWPLEFPNVFHRERPGFDVVVGNPPWNKVKFEMPSFLALHDPGIRGLRSSLERDERAERLFQQRPELRQEIEETQRRIEEQRRFFRPENGYTIQGSGDTDLYKLFCERYASIARKQGFMGVVLPRVAFLNDGSRGFRRWFFRECRPSRIDALLNSGRWAFDMEGRYTIALTTARVGVPVSGSVTISGPARNEREFAECIAGEGVQVDLAALTSWTPAPVDDPVKEPTWELPLLPTPTHVSVLTKLRSGVRFDHLQNPRNSKTLKGLPFHYPRIAFRAVSRATDSRTVISCLVPPKTPLTDRAPYIAFHLWEYLEQVFVLGVFDSIPFDWQARRSVETTLNYFILNALTFPPLDNTPWERISELAARLSSVDDRFAEFTAKAGVEWGPLTEARRNDMRAEIDALVARAYGLTIDELRFIFTDFTENAVSPAYRRQVLEKFEGL